MICKTATLEHFERNEDIKKAVNGAYEVKGHRPDRDSRITKEYIENLERDPECNAQTFEARVEYLHLESPLPTLAGMELASDSFGVYLVYNCRYYISSATGEFWTRWQQGIWWRIWAIWTGHWWTKRMGGDAVLLHIIWTKQALQ
jgi:hypothetical protein